MKNEKNNTSSNNSCVFKIKNSGLLINKLNPNGVPLQIIKLKSSDVVF